MFEVQTCLTQLTHVVAYAVPNFAINAARVGNHVDARNGMGTVCTQEQNRLRTVPQLPTQQPSIGKSLLQLNKLQTGMNVDTADGVESRQTVCAGKNALNDSINFCLSAFGADFRL